MFPHLPPPFGAVAGGGVTVGDGPVGAGPGAVGAGPGAGCF